MHRRVIEPNKLDECSLTLHHLSDDDLATSLRDGVDDDDEINEGARNDDGEEEEEGGGGEFELEELEFNEVDDELVGEFDVDSNAARE